jgi:hypothetical protein
MRRYADDWQNTPRALKMDFAKPVRHLFDLVKVRLVNWLFVGESAIVLILVLVQILRRRRISDLLAVLVLVILPVWSYLFALCLVIIPIPRYADATSAFVYIALLTGVWGLVRTCIDLVRRAMAGWPLAEQRV